MGSDDKVKETEQEKAFAQVFLEQQQAFEDVGIPAQDRVIADANESNDASVYQNVANDANLSYQKSFSDSGKSLTSNMAASGIDPSSGKFKGNVSSLADMEATKLADSTSRGQIDAQDRYTSKLSNVVAMGQGEAQQSVATLSDIAQGSQQQAFSDASASAASKNNTLGAIGAVGGAAASYASSAPTTLSAAEGSANYLDSNGEWGGP